MYAVIALQLKVLKIKIMIITFFPQNYVQWYYTIGYTTCTPCTLNIILKIYRNTFKSQARSIKCNTVIQVLILALFCNRHSCLPGTISILQRNNNYRYLHYLLTTVIRRIYFRKNQIYIHVNCLLIFATLFHHLDHKMFIFRHSSA
jgi:hypothetical protein